jgi:hypothetical protein
LVGVADRLAEPTAATDAMREPIGAESVLIRWFFLTTALASVVLYGREVSAASVEVQLYPLSGDVRLFNPNVTPFDFVYYELTSFAGAFTGVANWTSIADNYDAGGNGFIDPVNDWIEFPSTSSKLAEALFVGSSSALPAYRSIGLGPVWGPNVAQPFDVDATVIDSSEQLLPVKVVISLLGDYNRDLVVDASDYTVWRNEFGSTTSPFADGNFDGTVDAADYTVWRDHFGESLVGAGFGALLGLSGGGSAGGGTFVVGVVPEPGSVVLALLASLGLMALRRDRGKRISV